MMFILGMLLSFVLGMGLIAYISKEVMDDYIIQNYNLIKKQKELIEENSELKEIRINAEIRATQYARKIKQIEDIVLQKGQGSIVDRFDAIKKLVTDRKSEN